MVRLSPFLSKSFLSRPGLAHCDYFYTLTCNLTNLLKLVKNSIIYLFLLLLPVIQFNIQKKSLETLTESSLEAAHSSDPQKLHHFTFYSFCNYLLNY